MSQDQPGRLDRLDHLRLVACLMVMAWHFTNNFVPSAVVPRWRLLSLFEEGHTGVSFFCTISGFIFAWLYGRSPIAYGAFMRRRALRILPLFVVVSLLTVLLEPAVNILQLLGYATTLHRGPMIGYVAPGWSVLVELQFYAVFPFLILFARRYGTRYLVGLLLLAVTLRAMVWIERGAVQDLAYWTIFGRIDQFLAGMIAGTLTRRAVERDDARVRWAAIAAAVAAGYALLSTYAMFNQAGGFYGYGADRRLWMFLPLVEGIAYGLIISAYLLVPTVGLRGAHLVSAGVGFLGRISYSMYLTHVLVFAVTLKLLTRMQLIPPGPHGWEWSFGFFLVVGVPPVVLVSAATYALIEKPFLDLRRPAPAVPDREPRAVIDRAA